MKILLPMINNMHQSGVLLLILHLSVTAVIPENWNYLSGTSKYILG